MERGVRCIAEDGHVCLSLGEKTICDLLHRHGIVHEREVPYPWPSTFRADWAVGGTLIEYFGLTGEPVYDAKTAVKKNLAEEHGLKLIALYPRDLIERSRLLKKLGVDASSKPHSEAGCGNGQDKL
jgi:hypothetical protein